VHHVTPRSKGGSNELSHLITVGGKGHMLVSPVPEWLITKLWNPLEEISAVSEVVQNRIDEVMSGSVRQQPIQLA
jgi:hypothetical protein